MHIKMNLNKLVEPSKCSLRPAKRSCSLMVFEQRTPACPLSGKDSEPTWGRLVAVPFDSLDAGSSLRYPLPRSVVLVMIVLKLSHQHNLCAKTAIHDSWKTEYSHFQTDVVVVVAVVKRLTALLC